MGMRLRVLPISHRDPRGHHYGCTFPTTTTRTNASGMSASVASAASTWWAGCLASTARTSACDGTTGSSSKCTLTTYGPIQPREPERTLGVPVIRELLRHLSASPFDPAARQPRQPRTGGLVGALWIPRVG